MRGELQRQAILRTLKSLLGVLLVSTSAIAAPAREEDIELATPSGTLRGTLTFPATSSPIEREKRPAASVSRPRVVLMNAGSGPTDRNGNGPGFHPDSLRQLAHQLAGAGHAVVRYDKRGVGGSLAALRSEESDIRFTHYVDDTYRWGKSLADDSRFSGVVLLGHSEGALVAAMAAARVRPLGLVSIAGFSAPAGDNLRRQLVGKLPPELAIRSDQILTELERGNISNAVPELLLPLYRPSVQPYLISWFKIDPLNEFRQLSGVPTLVVQGDADLQVGVDDARKLHRTLPASTLAVIPGMNHVLKAVSGDEVAQTASYMEPSSPLSPALVTSIDSFLVSLQPSASVPASASRR